MKKKKVYYLCSINPTLRFVVDHKSCKKYKNEKASIECKRNFRWCIWLLYALHECPTSDGTTHITNPVNNALGPLSIRLSIWFLLHLYKITFVREIYSLMILYLNKIVSVSWWKPDLFSCGMIYKTQIQTSDMTQTPTRRPR